MGFEDAGCRAQFLIRDRDGKFPKLFDAVCRSSGMLVLVHQKSGITLVRVPSWRVLVFCRVRISGRAACGAWPVRRELMVAPLAGP